MTTNAQQSEQIVADARISYVRHAIDLLEVWIKSSIKLRTSRESNESPLELIMRDLHETLIDLTIDYDNLKLDASLAERIATGMAQAVLALKVTATTEAHFSK